eukprot:augustus_masked-scaffold_15-processed-gene-5.49-mRNA-1 protein AED:1.00 eAED:1.00 QI:0/-1/0/0/-1/1/1/0/682
MLTNQLWKLIFVCLLRRSCAQTYLSQEDFDRGTYIITQPGDYILSEDIVFEPKQNCVVDGSCAETIKAIAYGELDEQVELLFHPYATFNASQNLDEQFLTKSFVLGFFTAVSIETTGVSLDLNGFTIEQSELHALFQRFFALITLANAPFGPDAGPADFADDDTFVFGSQIRIFNGTLGKSAHHGIHGNFCEDVVLENLVIENFEVAGISLNSAKHVEMINVDIQNSRRDVPVSGRFSQAIFSLQSVSLHLDTFPAVALLEDLPEFINLRESEEFLRHEVLNTVLFLLGEGDFDEDELYPWKKLFITLTDGLPDGSLLSGVIIHPVVNVGDFSSEDLDNVRASNRSLLTATTFDIELVNVSVTNLSLAAVELAPLVLQQDDDSTPLTDVFGAVFDLDIARDPVTDLYVSNVLSDFQIRFAGLKHAVLEKCSLGVFNCSDVNMENLSNFLSRTKLPKALVEWTESDEQFKDFAEDEDIIVARNRDFMFHLVKGIVGVKIDGATSVNLDGVSVSNLENHADPKFISYLAQDENAELDVASFTTRGLSFASTVAVTGNPVVSNLLVKNIQASGIAVDYINDNEDIFLKVGSFSPDAEFQLDGTFEVENEPFITYVDVSTETCPGFEESESSSIMFAIATVMLFLVGVCFLVILIKVQQIPKKMNTDTLKVELGLAAVKDSGKTSI